jgi:long-chain acyl-CoA synthetase
VAAKKRLADLLVFRKLQKRTGGRLRFFISGGAPLAKEIAEFFYAAGMVIYEGYGLTETSPVIAVNNAKSFRPGTVGPLVFGVDVKIAQDGEILTRSPSVMMGYWKRPNDTAEVLVDGWLHTGDIGELSEDGFLKITDRKKDIIVTAGGKNVAPQPIENEIKLSRYVTEACLIGDKRKYIVALLVPNFESLEAYTARHELKHTERGELLASAEVQGLFQHLIDKVNQNRPSYEQIKYFRLLDHEFSQEEEELTPSMKVKRRVIQERYAGLLTEMYANEEN